MTKRKGISKLDRFEIFKRDGFTCQYCGSAPPTVLLEVDHIIPVADGGRNDRDNLTTACTDCNRGKAARSLDSVPQSLKDRAAEIAEREKQLRGYYNILEARRQRLEDETWLCAEAIEGRKLDDYNRANFASIRRFLEKLPFHVVLDAAEIASAKFIGSKCFRYFCGICWARIKGPTNG